MEKSSGRRRFLKSAAAMGAVLPAAGVSAQSNRPGIPILPRLK
jgi:hypothetical protein